MRPYDSDDSEFDELDDFGYPDVRAIRHMVNQKQREELRSRGRRRGQSLRRDPRPEEDWSDYESYDDSDFDDYDADEFDSYSGLEFDQH